MAKKKPTRRAINRYKHKLLKKSKQQQQKTVRTPKEFLMTDSEKKFMKQIKLKEKERNRKILERKETNIEE